MRPRFFAMNRQTDFSASLFPFAIITVVMTLASYWTPYALDNHLFEAALLRRCPDGFTLEGFFDYVDAIRRVDNWRLPNVLAPVMSLYAPKWLFALVTGLSIALTAYAAAAFSNGTADGMPMHHPQYGRVYMIYVFAAMLAFLPWANNLLTGDYAMNYIWGGALALGMLFAARAGIDRLGFRWLPALLGVVLGMWHEGIAMATVAGIAVMALCVRFERRYIPYYISGMATFVAGLLWMSFSYLTERASGEFSSAAVMGDTLRFVRYNVLAIFLLVYVVWQLTSPRRRITFFALLQVRPLAALFTGAAFAALVIAAVTSFSGRAAYWGEMTAVIAFAVFAEPFVVRYSHRWFVVAVGIVCLALCFTEILFCKSFDERYRAFEGSLANSPDGTVYGPVYLPQDFPAWLPQFVPRNLFVEPFTYRVLSERYAPRQAALVPVEFGLMNFRKDTTRPVETPEGNIYMAPRKDISAPVVLDSLDGVNKRFFAIPFSSRDGEMVCLYPVGD